MINTTNICIRAAEASNDFERNNTDLKREYLLHNIRLYNHIVKMVSGNQGSFGTGYPFYALNPDLTGTLPVIEEQLRYNNELINIVQNSDSSTWTCASCLAQNGSTMPDLKQVCKPCPNMDDAMKPRKVINRLPDIDMWMICEDGYLLPTSEKLTKLFAEHQMRTSDVDPVRTIEELCQIADSLKKGIMPKYLIPIDCHIMEYSKMSSLIEQVPTTIKQALADGKIPYLPIHPLSYRKKWQYDDTSYNFIGDYLYSFTSFNFEPELQHLLLETRRDLANTYSPDELYNLALTTNGPAVARRNKTLELKKTFEERIKPWKNY